MSAAFAWLCREGLIDPPVNPAAFTNRFEQKSRERSLTDDEIRAVWTATADVAVDPYCALVRLLMLLGCRRQELGLLRWSEIDLAAATISLAPARTKNARAFVIPLSWPALSILDQAPRRDDDDFVFGGACGFTGWSRNKASLDKRSGTSGWRLHDLRRTLSTRLHEDLLQPPHLIEATLGHAISGISGVYNRAQYLNERRRVLDLWAEHLLSLVGEGREVATNVVALTGRPQ